MMVTVPHVTSGLGLRKFQADGFLLTRVYEVNIILHENRFLLRNLFSIHPTSYVYKLIHQICIGEVQIRFRFPCSGVQKWF